MVYSSIVSCTFKKKTIYFYFEINNNEVNILFFFLSPHLKRSPSVWKLQLDEQDHSLFNIPIRNTHTEQSKIQTSIK